MTVVILDDHPLLSSGLARSLRGREVEAITYEPEAGANHVAEVLALSESIQLIVSDLVMPAVADTPELVARLSQHHPVVILSGSEDQLLLGKCLDAGAIGTISKNESIDVIVADLIGCANTGRLRPTERVAQLQTYHSQRRIQQAQAAEFAKLTAAEQGVLGHMCAGHSAARIAELRFVSIPTVRSQIKSILAKLDVCSQLEAVALAYKSGFSPGLVNSSDDR